CWDGARVGRAGFAGRGMTSASLHPGAFSLSFPDPRHGLGSLKNKTRVLLGEPALDLVVRRLEPWASEEAECESPAFFHARLPEWIDAGDRGEVDGRHLEEEQELAEGEGGHAGQR